MSITWSALGSEGQRTARRWFAECDAADQVLASSGAHSARPGMADLFAWATDPANGFGVREREALLRDPALRRDFSLLLARVASLRIPAAAAAASGHLETRSGPGLRIRIVASRADPAQVYVVLEIDQSVSAATLLVLRDGVPLVHLALPPDHDGHVQLMQANDSALVAALRDPTTELVLM
jgi:hypothetical protein